MNLRTLLGLLRGYRTRHPIHTATAQDLARLIRQTRQVADEAEAALLACEVGDWEPPQAIRMASAAGKLRDLGGALSKGTRVVVDRHAAMAAQADQIRDLPETGDDQ